MGSQWAPCSAEIPAADLCWLLWLLLLLRALPSWTDSVPCMGWSLHKEWRKDILPRAGLCAQDQEGVCRDSCRDTGGTVWRGASQRALERLLEATGLWGFSPRSPAKGPHAWAGLLLPLSPGASLGGGQKVARHPFFGPAPDFDLYPGSRPLVLAGPIGCLTSAPAWIAGLTSSSPGLIRPPSGALFCPNLPRVGRETAKPPTPLPPTPWRRAAARSDPGSGSRGKAGP